MRRRSKRWMGVLCLSVCACATAVGTGSIKNAEVDDGLDLYFREVDLLAPAPQRLERYIDAEPSDATSLPRAFSDAPPQIPHSVEDMLPITGSDNECVECHHPENVTGDEDKPIPDSHFEWPLLASGAPGEPMRWKVKGYRKSDELAGARFNCTTCHVVQATNVTTPASRFVREEPSD